MEELFLLFFVTSALQFDPRNALARYFIGHRLAHLPLFLPNYFSYLASFRRGLVPLSLENFSSRTVSSLLRKEAYVEPSCQAHFRPTYGQLHWPQTWDQLHICTLDRPIIDLNWKLAHGVLYTGARLAYDFHMAHVSPRCFCDAEDETLEHLFF